MHVYELQTSSTMYLRSFSHSLTHTYIHKHTLCFTRTHAHTNAQLARKKPVFSFSLCYSFSLSFTHTHIQWLLHTHLACKSELSATKSNTQLFKMRDNNALLLDRLFPPIHSRLMIYICAHIYIHSRLTNHVYVFFYVHTHYAHKSSYMHVWAYLGVWACGCARAHVCV